MKLQFTKAIDMLVSVLRFEWFIFIIEQNFWNGMYLKDQPFCFEMNPKNIFDITELISCIQRLG